MTSVLKLISLAPLLIGAAPAQVNVLTANYDTDRTNSNNNETILNPGSVSASTFGKLGTLAVDGQIFAQPLYVSGVSIGGHTHNVLYVVTMHDSVYAFDADAITASTPLWKVNLGTSIPPSTLDFTDVDIEVGILGTPAIDLLRQTMYLVSDTLENGNPTFRLHALSLADGHEMLKGPAVITGAVPGTSSGGKTVSFDAEDHLQRPGLAVLDREVYVAFGSHGDDPPWHGWLFRYDADNVQHQLAVFCTSPNGNGASIWQSGRAPAIDGGGTSFRNSARRGGLPPPIESDASIYLATGNGDYDGKTSFGESILRLSATNLTVQDWFTPDNWNDLNQNDWDLGSSGVILVPGTNQLVTAGKSGNLYLTPRNSMGHAALTNSETVQSFNVNVNGIWNTALWNNQSGPTVYAAEPFGGHLDAFRISNGVVSSQPQSQTQTFPTGYAAIAISSDSGKDTSGIVWLTTGDYLQTPPPGVLSAFDASDLTHQLWSSTTLPSRDAPGLFAKFVPVTVANGKVYVPTFSNQVSVYGLLNQTPPAGNSKRVREMVDRFEPR